MLYFIIIFILLMFYYYSVKNYGYWAKRNVKFEPPLPLFGNYLPIYIGLKNMTEKSVELYNKFPEEKVVGCYRGVTPALLIRDLDLIKHILVADFSYCYKRGISRNAEKEPLFNNVIFADGDDWKLLKQCLTPAFTSAKLRLMFPLVLTCAKRLQDLLITSSGKENYTDAEDLMSRYTMECIAACGFGIELNSINGKTKQQSQFTEILKLIFIPYTRRQFFFALCDLFPMFKKHYRIDQADMVEQAMKTLLKEVHNLRNGKSCGRHDFIDILLEIEAKGKVVGDSMEKFDSNGLPVQVELKMDPSCQIAQIVIFFAAGYQTSAMTTSFTLHMLAFHPEIQKKIQKEIDDVLSKYNYNLTYDALFEMTYLEMAFKESLRMHPPVGYLKRACAKKYKIPNLNFTIDPDVTIQVPIQAIHMDEKYFDNPSEFRPERFLPEAVKKRHKFSYLPFGEGPRACTGFRLAMMQSLAGLAAILQKFTVEPTESSNEKIKVSHKENFVQGFEGGLPLKFTPRNKHEIN